MSGQSLGGVHTLTVASKHKFYVKRPSTFTLIRTGGFPAELASQVWGLFNKKLDMDTFGTDPTAMMKYAEMVDKYWPYVLIGLKVVEDAEEVSNHVDDKGCVIGTCHSGDLDDLDKQDLFMYGIGLQQPDKDSVPSPNGAAAQTLPEPQPQEATVRDLDQFRDRAERDDARPRREPVRAETEQSVGAPVDDAPSA